MSGEIAPVPAGQSTFGERYVVDTSAPLPEFSSEGGNAYKVSDQEKSGQDLYALVQHPTVPVRNEVYKSLKARPAPNCVNPVNRGLMILNIDGKQVQRLVTIFDKPGGEPLMGLDGKISPRVNTARLRQSIILSLVKALTALHKRGLTHRCITPSNIYFSSMGGEEVWLGECYSIPPGFKQPHALEPIDLALADKSARGQAAPDADYFQLGAVLQCLYFGEMLWRGRQRDAFTMARINQGSFWALGGGREIPGALGSVIRGLMADEPEERWGAEDILDWFEGVGKPKRMLLKTWTMSRPTKFKGVAYVDRRLLANAFARDPKEAVSFLKQLDFAAWVQLSLRDEVLSEKLERTIGVKQDSDIGGARTSDYKMVTRVCSFLHPGGPIHYKGYSLFLDGLPSMLADAFARDDRDLLTTIVELFDHKLMTSLAEIVASTNQRFVSQWDQLQLPLGHATSKQLGRGMERVLYELNPILPCISQRFSQVWIGSVKQIMTALDRMAGQGNIRNALQDRHLAAYCCGHGEDLVRLFNNIAAAQHDPARLGSLTAEFFSLMQQRFKLGPLNNLTEKLVDGLAPAVKALRNRKRRERVQMLLDKIRKTGDVGKLTSEVNMMQIQAQDTRDFAQAKAAVTKLEKERMRLSRKILPTDVEARQKGIRGSRIVAFVIMVIIGFLTFT